MAGSEHILMVRHQQPASANLYTVKGLTAAFVIAGNRITEAVFLIGRLPCATHTVPINNFGERVLVLTSAPSLQLTAGPENYGSRKRFR